VIAGGGSTREMDTLQDGHSSIEREGVTVHGWERMTAVIQPDPPASVMPPAAWMDTPDSVLDRI